MHKDKVKESIYMSNYLHDKPHSVFSTPEIACIPIALSGKSQAALMTPASGDTQKATKEIMNRQQTSGM